MAFKLALSATYSAEVTVEYLGEDGKPVKQKFTAIFKRKTQEEQDSLRDRLQKGDLGDRAFLQEVMVGWQGVLDADGDELEFTPENFEMAMNVHPMQPCTVRAWFDSQSGARRGN